MRISTAGRYALRAMLDLSLHGQQNPLQRQEIADHQALSSEYLAQLFRLLSRAGLTYSIMGPGGGYKLARPAQDIHVAEILTAVEGPLSVVPCLLDEGQGCKEEAVCPRTHHCAAQLLWGGLNNLITEYLNAITLADLSALASQMDAHVENASDLSLPEWVISSIENHFPALPLDFAI